MQLLLQLFMFNLKYLCRYQLCKYIDLRCNFKLSHDKIIFSWNIYSNLVKGIVRDNVLVKLIHLCRYQGYIS